MASSSSRYVPPYSNAFDANGATAPGNVLTFWVSGGAYSTPKQAFSDATWTTPITSITAGADGKYGSCFLGSGEYGLQERNSAGTLLWSADPVSAALTTAASTSVAGVIQIATNAQALLGTSSVLAIVPSTLAQAIQQGFDSGTSGGSANAITGTPSITPIALADGMKAVIKAASSNTGATTFNWAGLGVVAVKVHGGAGATACVGGEIVISNTYEFTYSAADSCWFPAAVGWVPGAIAALTEDTTPDGTADFFTTYDTSAKLPKKVKPQSLSATQAQMEAFTAIGAYVTPGNAQWHPGVSKANGNWTVAVSIQSSYNLASVTDNAAGDYSPQYTTAFSGATKGIIVSDNTTSGTNTVCAKSRANAAASCQIILVDAGPALSETGQTAANFAAYGDQ